MAPSTSGSSDPVNNRTYPSNQSWPQQQGKLIIMHTDPVHDAARRAIILRRQDLARCLDVTGRTKPKDFFGQDEIDSHGKKFCNTVLAHILDENNKTINDFITSFNAERIANRDWGGIWRICNQSVEETFDTVTIDRYSHKFLQHVLWVIRSGAPSEKGKTLEDYTADAAAQRAQTSVPTGPSTTEPSDAPQVSSSAVTNSSLERSHRPSSNIAKSGTGEIIPDTRSATSTDGRHHAIDTTATAPRVLPSIPEHNIEESRESQALADSSNINDKNASQKADASRISSARNSSRKRSNSEDRQTRVASARQDNRMYRARDVGSSSTEYPSSQEPVLHPGTQHPRSSRAASAYDRPQMPYQNFGSPQYPSMGGPVFPAQLVPHISYTVPQGVAFADQIDGLPRITNANIGPLAGMTGSVPVVGHHLVPFPEAYGPPYMLGPPPPSSVPPRIQTDYYQPMRSIDRPISHVAPTYPHNIHDGVDERAFRAYGDPRMSVDPMSLSVDPQHSSRAEGPRGRGNRRRGDNGNSYNRSYFEQSSSNAREYGPSSLEPYPAFQQSMRGNSRGRRYKNGSTSSHRGAYSGRSNSADEPTTTSWRHGDRTSITHGDSAAKHKSFSSQARQHERAETSAYGPKSPDEPQSDGPNSQTSKGKRTAKFDRDNRMRAASADPTAKEIGRPASSADITPHTRKPTAASEGTLSDESKEAKSAAVPPSSPPGGRGPDSFDEAKTHPAAEHPHPAVHRVGSNLSANFSTADNDEVDGGSVGTSASSDDPLKPRSRKSRKKRPTKATESSRSVGSPHPLGGEPLFPASSISGEPLVTEPDESQNEATGVNPAADQVDVKSKPQFAPDTSSKVIAKLPDAATEDRSSPTLCANDPGNSNPPVDSEIPPKSSSCDFSAELPEAKQFSPKSSSARDQSNPERVEGPAFSDAESSQTLMPDSKKATQEPSEASEPAILTPSSSKSGAAEPNTVMAAPSRHTDVAQASSHAAQTPLLPEPAIPKKNVKPKGPAQTEALNPFAGQKAKRDREKKAAKAQRKKEKQRAAAGVPHQKENFESAKTRKSIDAPAQIGGTPAVKKEEADAATAAEQLVALLAAHSQEVSALPADNSKPAPEQADVSQPIEEPTQRVDTEPAAPANAPAPLMETDPNITKQSADSEEPTEAAETSAKASPPKKQKRKQKKKAVAVAEPGPSTGTIAKENAANMQNTAKPPNTYPPTGGSGSPGRGLLKALREPFLGLIGGTFPINHRHYDRGPYIIPEAPPESE